MTRTKPEPVAVAIERTVRGDLINLLRKSKGLTTEQLARASSLSRRTIEKAEGGYDIRVSTIHKIAASLSVPPKALIDFDIVVPTLEEVIHRSVVEQSARPVKLPLPAAEASTPRLP